MNYLNILIFSQLLNLLIPHFYFISLVCMGLVSHGDVLLIQCRCMEIAIRIFYCLKGSMFLLDSLSFLYDLFVSVSDCQSVFPPMSLG